MNIEDITELQGNPPDLPEHHLLDLDRRVVERRPEEITGVVIHQTCGWLELDLLKADGDRHEARRRAAAELPFHAVALSDGSAYQVKELRWHVRHGPSLCDSTLGLGIEGVYGRGSKELPARHVTEKTVRAARAALAHLVDAGRKRGMPIQYVYAHRQTALDAIADDPGEELWRRVVLEYGAPQLGLRVRPVVVYSAGLRPLPLCVPDARQGRRPPGW